MTKNGRKFESASEAKPQEGATSEQSTVPRQWDADVPLDEVVAQRLIASQFPELRGAKVVRLSEGWDNYVFSVAGENVFRFPRRKVAVACMEAEIAALPYIAQRLDTPLSNPEWVGEGSEAYPYPFAGYRMLSGGPPHIARPTREARAACAVHLARFLRTLHSLDWGPLVSRLPGDTIGRLDVTKRVPQFWRYHKEASERGLLDAAELQGLAELAREMEEFATRTGITRLSCAASTAPSTVASSAASATPCLVHGDLNFRNYLVSVRGEAGSGSEEQNSTTQSGEAADQGRSAGEQSAERNERRTESGRLTGVIDWGDVHLGHPAVDLAVAYGYLPPEGRKLFFQHYGDIDEETARFARFRALYVNLYILVYAEDIGDTLQAEEARLELEFVRAHDSGV